MLCTPITPSPWRRRNDLFCCTTPYHTTTILRPFFQDHPGEPVPEENFWTLWCKGRLTEADTLTIPSAAWCYLQRTCYNALWMGRKTPNCPSLGFRNHAEEDQATAIGNMDKKLGKDHACCCRDAVSDRQTHRHAHHNTLPLLLRAKYQFVSTSTVQQPNICVQFLYKQNWQKDQQHYL